MILHPLCLLLRSVFFVTEVSRLLIEIAIAVRVRDDQMKNRPHSDSQTTNYYNLRASVDDFDYGEFDDSDLNLQKTCNKIIHAYIMRPHFVEGQELNEYDYADKYGDGEKAIIGGITMDIFILAGRTMGLNSMFLFTMLIINSLCSF